MERRLLIVRHAKASHGDYGSDHARPLTDRGRADAQRLSERLVTLGWIPERVLCSDAVRTVETWMTMSARMPHDIDVLFTPKLYGAGLSQLAELLAEQPDTIRTLMAVGHNPGWEQLVSVCTGQLTAMGTANAALLVREIDSWRNACDLTNCSAPRWRLAAMIRPTDER